MGDLVAEVSLSGFFHFGENHGTNFLWGLIYRKEKSSQISVIISWSITYEVPVPAFVFDGDGGFAIFFCHFERPVLHVASNVLIIHFASDKTLSIDYGVFWVGVESIFSAVTDTETNMSVFSRC